MKMPQKVKTIAVLGVDGENYAVDGVYMGKSRTPSWYTLTRTSNNEVCVKKLEEFPSCDTIRKLMH